MNCVKCGEKYDTVQRVPRVLVECGHTLCEMCIVGNSKAGFITCPECGKSQFGSVQNFPKNLTLLTIKDSQPSDAQLCRLHRKPFEGFCQKDKQLLCVSCILEEEHRTHSISSISQTVSKDKEILLNASQRIATSKEQIQKFAKVLQQLQQKLDQNYGQCLMDIRLFYQTLRQALATREQQSKSSAQQMYKTQTTRVQTMRNELVDKFEFFSDLTTIYHSVSRLKEVEYLNQSNKRLFIMENSHFKLPKMDLQLKPIVFGKMEELKKVQMYLQEIEQDGRKPSERDRDKDSGSRLKTQNFKKKVPKEEKKEPVVLELNLHQKYKKHIQIKKQKSQRLKDPFEQEKINLSEIGYKGGGSYSLNNSLEDILKTSQDISLSIKDHNVTIEELSTKIYHLGGCGINNVQTYEPEMNKSTYTIHLLQRTKFQAVILPDGKNDKILIIGGKKKDNWQRLDTILLFDTAKNILQESDCRLMQPRSGFGAVVHQQKLFIVGGSDSKSIVNSLEQYSLKGLVKPKKLQGMQMARDELCAVLGYNGSLYALGGSGVNGNTLSSCQKYDFLKNKWQPISPMSTPRRSFIAIGLPDGIYALGGYDGKSHLPTAQKYDYYTDRWQPLKPMLQPRSTHSAIVTSDYQYIFVFGGFHNNPLKSIEAYSISEDRWRKIGEMVSDRFMHNSILLRH